MQCDFLQSSVLATVRCCVFLMGPMASATVMDFGISTSTNIYGYHIMICSTCYIYIYISYTYKETANLDISDFWYKYNISICICIYTSYTLYYSVILYIYMLSDTSQHVLFFHEIGWFERMLPNWQPSEATLYHGYPWLFVSHICPGFGMLVLECQGRSGGGGSLSCWNCEIPMSKMDGTSWKGLSLKLLRFESFGVCRCPFSAPTSGHYRYRPSSIWRRPGIKRGFACPELTRWIFVESQRRKTRQACVCKMITLVVLSTSAMSNPQT